MKNLRQPVKRLFVLLVAVIMTMALMSACTSTSAPATSPLSSATSETTQLTASAEPTTAEEPMTLEIWTPDAAKIKDSQPIWDMLEKKFNVKFSFVQITSDMETTVNLRITSGDIPETLRDYSFSAYGKYFQQGLLAELPVDLIKTNAPRLYDWAVKNGGDSVWKYYERDGKNYALPILWTLATQQFVVGYREDLLKKAGYDAMPETLDDMEKALLAIKNTLKISPLSGTGIDDFSFVYGAFGVYPSSFYAKDGKIVYGGVNPDAKKALAVLSRWYKEGLIDPEFMVNKFDNIKEKWTNDKAAVVQTQWFHFLPQEAFWGGYLYEPLKDRTDVSIKIMSAPKGPDGLSGLQQSNPIQSGLSFSKAIEQNQAKLKKYLQVFDYAFDQETLDLLQFGVKNVTYTYDDSTGVKWIPPYDTAEKRTEYGIGIFWNLPGCFNDYNLSAKYMTQPSMRTLRNEAEAKGIGVYDILTPTYRPVYNEKNEELKTIVVNAHIDFITGARPLSEFDSFVNEWLASGGQDVMNEADTAYQSLN